MTEICAFGNYNSQQFLQDYEIEYEYKSSIIYEMPKICTENSYQTAINSIKGEPLQLWVKDKDNAREF